MRSQPTFESSLACRMEQFVVHKRMQGFEYTASATALKCFDRFLCDVDCSDGRLRDEYFMDYYETVRPLSTNTHRYRLGVVHQFSLFLNAYCPESRVMPLQLLPRRPPQNRFYRISAKEVFGLMQATESLPAKSRNRYACIRFLIGLIYTTGLRISEALSLNLGDIDCEKNTLFIHHGKFEKDRLIKISPSTRNALDEWLHIRQEYAGTGKTAPLFVSTLSKRLTPSQARYTFKKCCILCDLNNEPPPRLHDLRHNYATECLARWQREGKDIQILLPVLSTAMGHVKPESTEYYIHINAETLRQASIKTETHFNQTIRGIQ